MPKEISFTRAEVEAELKRFNEEVPDYTAVAIDPRCDHRQMLVEAEARHWRILGFVARGIGKQGIMKAERCKAGRVHRSYQFLKLRGYAELGANGRMCLTPAGAEKVVEGD